MTPYGYRCSFCQHMATGGITGTDKTEDGRLVYICPDDINRLYELIHGPKDD